MDVTPRALTDVSGAPDVSGPAAPGGEHEAARRRTRRTRIRGWLLGLAVVAALVFVLLRGLGNATLFFYNADEAVAKREQLGADRFRLLGNVVTDTVDRSSDGARFMVSFNEVEVSVVHHGEIPQLFQPGIPVVLEGRWQGDVFTSDRMVIKHNEVYVEDNPDRVADYGEGEGANRS
jgi:cytochrome c-type biogenesis protein CcmE